MQNETNFLSLPHDEQKSIIEAVIFASDEVITYKTLYKLLVTHESILPNDESGFDSATGEMTIDSEIAEQNNFTPQSLEEIIQSINQDLINTGRPFQIVNFANGYQFATLQHYGAYIHNLIKTKTKRRLSQASMETLAIIAYKQPVTKPEIEQIRGVNSNEIVNALIEKNLVRIAGRKDVLGKPLLYATTSDFLKTFGLKSIDDLPRLREIDDIAAELSGANDETDDMTITITKSEADNILKSSRDFVELEETNEIN